MTRIWRAVLAAALLSPPAATATVLTLDDALERARREAPAVLAARLRPEEASGRLAGASVLLRDNPVIEAAAGRRSSGRGVSTDVEASIGQTFELGSRRGSRIAGAEAELEHERARADDVTRQLLAEVASAFLRAVAAEQRLRALRAGEDVAAGVVRTAEHRHRAGEVADLDANLARVAAWRARADVRAAEAACARTLGDVKTLLGMDAAEPLAVRGDLRFGRERRLEELLANAAERPDLRMLAAEMRAAEAEVRLGEGHRWPDLGVRVGYAREEDADIPLAGLSVSLPVLARGQEQRIAGAARARRLRLETAARRRAIEVEVRAAFDAHRHLLDGVEELERHALPLLDDSEALAERGWEAGELTLIDYLAVRREAVGTRLDHVERSLEAALAAVEVDTRAGVLR